MEGICVNVVNPVHVFQFLKGRCYGNQFCVVADLFTRSQSISGSAGSIFTPSGLYARLCHAFLVLGMKPDMHVTSWEEASLNALNLNLMGAVSSWHSQNLLQWCQWLPHAACRSKQIHSKNNSVNSAHASSLFSLPVCRVILRIARARHARLIASMLAIRPTILTWWDRLKVANILVASS